MIQTLILRAVLVALVLPYGGDAQSTMPTSRPHHSTSTEVGFSSSSVDLQLAMVNDVIQKFWQWWNTAIQEAKEKNATDYTDGGELGGMQYAKEKGNSAAEGAQFEAPFPPHIPGFPDPMVFFNQLAHMFDPSKLFGGAGHPGLPVGGDLSALFDNDLLLRPLQLDSMADLVNPSAFLNLFNPQPQPAPQQHHLPPPLPPAAEPSYGRQRRGYRPNPVPQVQGHAAPPPVPTYQQSGGRIGAHAGFGSNFLRPKQAAAPLPAPPPMYENPQPEPQRHGQRLSHGRAKRAGISASIGFGGARGEARVGGSGGVRSNGRLGGLFNLKDKKLGREIAFSVDESGAYIEGAEAPWQKGFVETFGCPSLEALERCSVSVIGWDVSVETDAPTLTSSDDASSSDALSALIASVASISTSTSLLRRLEEVVETTPAPMASTSSETSLTTSSSDDMEVETFELFQCCLLAAFDEGEKEAEQDADAASTEAATSLPRSAASEEGSLSEEGEAIVSTKTSKEVEDHSSSASRSPVEFLH